MIPGSANPLLLASAAAAPTGYTIERSLRFNSADSAYLSRVFGSPTNQIKFTFSTWVKRSTLGGLQRLFTGGNTDYSDSTIAIASDNTIFFAAYNGTNALTGALVTSQVFRDTGAWFHLVAVYDSANGTAADRMQIYVNGVRITAFTTQTNPPQNAIAHRLNTSGAAHYIGSSRGISDYFSGYLADIHFIDGQALTPTSFGEFDANNVWQPKAYTGSYGTNGFQLKFADNSAATAAALGKDTSGNANNWTPNNLSVTAGAGNDSLVDTPTSYGTDDGLGGSVRGNYATLNPLDKTPSYGTLSNGNLDWAYSGQVVYAGARSTIGVSTGKWYFECTANGAPSAGFTYIGVATKGFNFDDSTNILITGNETRYYRSDGSKSTSNGSQTTASYGASYTTGDVIGIALDLDAGTITFYKNGTTQGQAYSGLSGTYFACGSSINNSGGLIWNFGQRPFAYTAPSGFKALCTANLPTPTIANPATAMDVKLYTGNNSTNVISGLQFSPDLVWTKGRNYVVNNCFFDSIRGPNKLLASNNTDAEIALSDTLNSFDSAGFTLGTDPNGLVNDPSQPYVAWAWDAGSSTVTNTSGSISSQVRANTSAGFSMVTYTGTGANASVGHGLGSPPAFIIIKQRNGAIVWVVYHKDVGTNAYLSLDTTLASTSNSNYWGASAPSSTVFNLSTYGGNNGSANTYVAYCFAPVAGYSAFGSYTGNGSADGPFVFLGFRPAVVIVKMSSSTGNWTILDDKREGYNVDNDPLFPNLTNAEGTTDLIDITSNGFKVRTTDATFNTNAGTYVYAAWASSPFAYARAR